MTMLDFNSERTASLSTSEKINALVDLGLTAVPQTPRPYIGASSLGADCERAVQLDHIHARALPGAPEPGQTFSGNTLRVFAAGHVYEELAIGWLRQAGFDLKDRNRNGGQFGFSVADNRFRGHVDGVLLSGPDLMTYPALWEHKALGRKSWQEVVKKGVTKARPTYAAQIALYQAYLNLEASPALFTATNRDTLELYHEVIPFDGALAQAMSDRAVRLLQATDAGELLPRVSDNPDYPTCKMCGRWRSYCWKSQG